MQPIRFLISLCLLLLFSSCSYETLRVQVDYISRENLASFHVGTPDPRLLYPPQGQRLILTWYIPYHKIQRNIAIKLNIRYGNHTEEVKWIYPKKAYGFHIYCLQNRDYYSKCGILTYKAEMYIDHCLTKEWRHQLWTQLITFKSESEMKTAEDAEEEVEEDEEVDESADEEEDLTFDSHARPNF